jgi:hypothetical protein
MIPTFRRRGSKLAECIGCRHPHLVRIIAGTGRPSLKLVERIVRFTGGEVSADDVVSWSLYHSRTDTDDNQVGGDGGGRPNAERAMAPGAR